MDITHEHFLKCHRLGRHHAPVAFRLLLTVNHVFIILNSSANFILYCMVGKDFREKLKLIFRGCCKKSSN
jgi:hypothetical protein